jgi:hypothetical protein
MKLTMGQAAKEAGISKPTLSRAIKSGKVSATPTGNGGWEIDPAELFRAFPPKPQNGFSNGGMEPLTTPRETDETPALRAEIAGLRAQLELMREKADYAQEQAAAWQRQAESAQRLLTDQSEKRRGWFGLGR